eukprot:COSAG06_NODE_6968_length_2687_cov_812.940224_1_plen_179_part_00
MAQNAALTQLLTDLNAAPHPGMGDDFFAHVGSHIEQVLDRHHPDRQQFLPLDDAWTQAGFLQTRWQSVVPGWSCPRGRPRPRGPCPRGPRTTVWHASPRARGASPSLLVLVAARVSPPSFSHPSPCPTARLGRCGPPRASPPSLPRRSSSLGATIVDLSRMGGEKHKQHSYGTSVVVA